MPRFESMFAQQLRRKRSVEIRQRRAKRRKKEPSEAKPAKEILYLSLERGEIHADFEKQLRLEGEINSILLSSYGECKHPDHTCHIIGDGAICRGMQGGCGRGLNEVYLRYFLPVGPTLNQIREPLLQIGSDCHGISITLGNKVGRGYFPAKMM
jgi:hypothetical protein